MAFKCFQYVGPNNIGCWGAFEQAFPLHPSPSPSPLAIHYSCLTPQHLSFPTPPHSSLLSFQLSLLIRHSFISQCSYFVHCTWKNVVVCPTDRKTLINHHHYSSFISIYPLTILFMPYRQTCYTNNNKYCIMHIVDISNPHVLN